MSSVRLLSAAPCWLALAALGGAGCGSAEPEPPSPTGQNLQKVGDAYLRATMQLNRPPANLKELRPFLKEQGKPDEIIKSPADGQPFVLVWGVELRQLKATGNAVPVVAFEKDGKDGRRHVLRGRADVRLLSEGELKSATFPKGYVLPF